LPRSWPPSCARPAPTPWSVYPARWDLSIVITAASLAAWHALAQLPAVIRVFDQLAQRAPVVKAWTFEAVGGGEA
jgi:hypothetical protein